MHPRRASAPSWSSSIASSRNSQCLHLKRARPRPRTTGASGYTLHPTPSSRSSLSPDLLSRVQPSSSPEHRPCSSFRPCHRATRNNSSLKELHGATSPRARRLLCLMPPGSVACAARIRSLVPPRPFRPSPSSHRRRAPLVPDAKPRHVPTTASLTMAQSYTVLFFSFVRFTPWYGPSSPNPMICHKFVVNRASNSHV
ncbi:hypothetical protein D1007_44627 [Hordeum vulgare]|nr:hypothetical protein D1007_44627 [Hordeum vulgare]